MVPVTVRKKKRLNTNSKQKDRDCPDQRNLIAEKQQTDTDSYTVHAAGNLESRATYKLGMKVQHLSDYRRVFSPHLPIPLLVSFHPSLFQEEQG